MYDFHLDRKRYFDIQKDNATEYVIPFIEETFSIKPGMRVLEIGCGEGGVIKAFLERGCTAVGVELDAPRLELGRTFLAEELQKGCLSFIAKDIYEVDVEKELGGAFDIIILKDVIEHIHDQKKLVAWMKTFLKSDGVVFFGFPPWYMPFGGHQQICRSKVSKLPYIHLLPRRLYKWILKKNNEDVDELMEIVDTQISIEQFEAITKATGYTISGRKHYLFNPIYKWKFGVKAREQFGLVKAVPFVRNFFTTCVYYTIRPQQD